MKFLENEKLAQLTAQLTDVVVGTGECVINGRIEAFTMKRAGTDKKLAHELGEKYQAEIKVVESEMAEFQRTLLGRMRSNSLGAVHAIPEKESRLTSSSLSTKNQVVPFQKKVRIDTSSKGDNGRRRSNSIGIPLSEPKIKARRKVGRSRSDSYDGKSQEIRSILRKKGDSTDLSNPSRSRSDSFLTTSSTSSDLLNSPLGDFHDSSTQRLMTDLILTLNASFPDYDFSNIRPSHFAKLPSQNVAINRTNEKLAELTTNRNQGANFLTKLWSAVNDVISMKESEVYSYVPPQRDDDDDPLGFLTQTLDGTDSDEIVPLWTLNFFFVNKSMKRIVLFTCVQTMRNDVDANMVDDEDDAYVEAPDEVKEVLSYDNYGIPMTSFRLSRENSAVEDDIDEDDDDQSWNDFDVDTTGMGQPAPSTTVA